MEVILILALVLAIITLLLAITVYSISIGRSYRELVRKAKDDKNNPRQ